jgi:hypothetical protein
MPCAFEPTLVAAGRECPGVRREWHRGALVGPVLASFRGFRGHHAGSSTPRSERAMVTIMAGLALVLAPGVHHHPSPLSLREGLKELSPPTHGPPRQVVQR